MRTCAKVIKASELVFKDSFHLTRILIGGDQQTKTPGCVQMCTFLYNLNPKVCTT